MKRAWGTPPELREASAAEHYADKEAARYTNTGARIGIQQDMSRRAIDLMTHGGWSGGEETEEMKEPAAAPSSLPAHPGLKNALLADLGCGSCLSSAELSACGSAWLGLDVSPSMLQVGRQLPSCRGRLALADLARALPIRPASLDGAISISALQWLCVPARAEDLTLGLFEGLGRALKPGARAVLQVYMRGDRDVDLFVWAALRARLRAAYVVDYSHASDAKKYYFVVERSEGGGDGVEVETKWRWCDGTTLPASRKLLYASLCNLGWPQTASCSLWWAARAPLASEAPWAARMRRAHAAHATRMLRMGLRAAGEWVDAARAEREAGIGRAEREAGIGRAENEAGNRRARVLEGSAPSPGLLRCCGPVFVAWRRVSPEGQGGGEAAARANFPPPDEQIVELLRAPAGAFAVSRQSEEADPQLHAPLIAMLQECRWRCQNGLDLHPSGYSNPYFSLTVRQELPASARAEGCVSVFEAPKQAHHLALLLRLPAAPGWPSRLHAALSSLLQLLSSAVVVGLAVEEHAADPRRVGVLGLLHDARSYEDGWKDAVASAVRLWWDAACREGF